LRKEGEDECDDNDGEEAFDGSQEEYEMKRRTVKSDKIIFSLNVLKEIILFGIFGYTRFPPKTLL
jgi:hypothetical protein